MIRAAGTDGRGRKLMFLGLSGENITRLAAGEPIAFDGDELGFAGTVVIAYGPTEDAIVDQLRAFGAPMRVHDRRGGAR